MTNIKEEILDMEITKIETGYIISAHYYGGHKTYACSNLGATLTKVKELFLDGA